MSEDYYWRTEDPMVFEIDGQQFDLDTKGVAYAEQFGRLTGWLGTHGLQGLFAAYDSGAMEGDQDAFVVIGYLLQYGVSPDAIIELGAILLNSDREFAEEHFDPGWLVDALFILFDEKPGIKSAFTRVWERFFLGDESSTPGEEDQA